MTDGLKIINKENKSLEGIVKGDKTEVIGISDDQQMEKGLVVYADGPKIGLKLIAIKEGEEIIRIESYFDTPSGVKMVSKPEIYKKGSKDFKKYYNLLSNAGL